MSETNSAPILEIGYYHPTEAFTAMREHLCVMDTSKPGLIGDGELIALFGPSQCSGASQEEAAASRRQASLFIAGADLRGACEAAEQCITDLIDCIQRGAADVVFNQALGSCKKDALPKLRSALAKANAE